MFVGIFACGVSHALAASGLTIPTEITDLDEQVDVTLTPNYPGPLEKYSIKLEAYGIDLNLANIVWSVNGKSVLEGRGEVVYNGVAQSVGVSTNITITITPKDSKQIVKKVTINPQTVDILWEARGVLTPPFYRGKSLPPTQSKARFVAMPNLITTNGSLLDPASLNYNWTQDYSVLGDKSGHGKNYLDYTADILSKPVNVQVEAYDSTGMRAIQDIDLGSFNSAVLMYENNPLYGYMFNDELTNGFDLGTHPETTIAAFPFSYNAINRTSQNLEYVWNINGTQIDVPTSQTNLAFRNSNNSAGKSMIGVSLTNTNNLLEASAAQFLINFAKTDSVLSF